MAKYRKKPIVVEAVQWKGILRSELPEGCQFASGALVCQTLEGPLTVSIDDWIITGVKGERYPCKPDVFAETYDAVKDGE